MQTDEKTVPVPQLFIDAAGHDVVIEEGSVGLADDAAPECPDLLGRFEGQLFEAHEFSFFGERIELPLIHIIRLRLRSTLRLTSTPGQQYHPDPMGKEKLL